MGIRSLKTASISTGVKRSKVWDQSAVVLVGAFESIATVSVTSNQSSVSFSSIPSTYKHLQIRYTGTTDRGTYASDGIYLRFNGDTGANYSYHVLRGRGSDVSPGGGGSETSMYLDWGLGTTVTNYPASGIFDFLDYTNTNKTKVFRGLFGLDTNGPVSGYQGAITFGSGGWYNTSAISSITFTPVNGGNISPNSKFALYGIKG